MPCSVFGLPGGGYAMVKHSRSRLRPCSVCGRKIRDAKLYRQEFKTPLRMYYGSNDEVVRTRTGLLAAEYQETLVDTPDAPSSNRITPVLVEGGDHRLTFITAAPAAKMWMDSLP